MWGNDAPLQMLLFIDTVNDEKSFSTVNDIILLFYPLNENRHMAGTFGHNR